MRNHILATKLLATSAIAIALTACGSSEISTPPSDETLAAFGLTADSTGLITFETKVEEGNAAIFQDASLNVGPMSIAIGSVRIAGAELTEDGMALEALTFSDITVPGPSGDEIFSLGGVTLEGPTPEIALAIASTMSGTDPAQAFEGVDYKEVTFEKLGVEKLIFAFDDGYEAASIRVGEFAFTDLTQDAFGKIALTGVDFDLESYDTGPITGALGEVSISGIDRPYITGIVDAVIAGVASGDPETAMVSAWAAAVPEDIHSKKVDAMNIQGVTATVQGITTTIDSLTGTITETSTGLKNSATGTGITISTDGDGELGSQLAMQLAMLGYEALEFELEAVAETNRETDSATETATLSMIDGFDLETKYAMSGFSEYLSRSVELMSPEMMLGMDTPEIDDVMSMYEPLIIDSFSISLADQGLADRGFELAAAYAGTDAASMRATAVGGVSSLAFFAPTPETQKLAGEFIVAAQTFINEPGTKLTIAATPAEPFEFAGLMADIGELSETGGDPMALLDEVLADLSISITAEASQITATEETGETE